MPALSGILTMGDSPNAGTAQQAQVQTQWPEWNGALRQDVALQPVEKMGFMAGMGGGFMSSYPATVISDVLAPTFVRDWNFDGSSWYTAKVTEDPNFAAHLNPTEVQLVKQAKNEDQANYIIQRANDRQYRDLATNQRPVAAFLGNVLGDIAGDLTIGAGVAGASRGIRATGVMLTGPVAQRTVAQRVLDGAIGLATGSAASYSYELSQAENRVLDMNVLLNGAFVGAGAFAKAAPVDNFVGVQLQDAPAFRGLAEDLIPQVFKRTSKVRQVVALTPEEAVQEGAAKVLANGARTGEEIYDVLARPDWMVREDSRRVVQILKLDHRAPADALRKLVASVDGTVASSMAETVSKEVAQQYANLTTKLVKTFMPKGTKVILAAADDAAKGMTIPVGKGTFLVNIAPGRAMTKEGFGTLFHELGHIIINQHFKNMPAAVKDALLARFLTARKLATAQGSTEAAQVEFRSALQGGRAEAAAAGRQGKTFAEFTAATTVDAKGSSRPEAILGFNEYAAEQFVKVMQDKLLREGVEGFAQNAAQRGALESYVGDVVTALSRMSKEIQPYAKAAPEANAAFEWAATRGLDYDLAGYKASLKDTAMRLAEDSIELANSKAVMQRAAGFLGGDWASLYERLANAGQSSAELAKKLLMDPLGTSASNAAMDVRRIRLRWGSLIAPMEKAISDATGFGLLERSFHKRSAFLARQREISSDLVHALHQRHAKFLRGEEILPHADPVIEDLLQKYEKSQWATEALREIKASGVRGADNITESPWYFPVQHSGEKIHEAVHSGMLKLTDAYDIYAKQFSKMFPTMTDAEAKAAGARMVTHLTDPLYAGHKPGLFAGITRDEVEQVMRDIGISDTDAAEFLRTFEGKVNTTGTPKNLQHRLEWDFSVTSEINGEQWGIRDFLNTDFTKVAEGYTRVMAGRSALARQGFDSLAAVDSAITEATRGVKDPKAVREVFENTVDSLLGRHVGERLPDTVRTMGSFSAFLSLKNSGLYQLIDLATVQHRYGIVKMLKAVKDTGLTLKDVDAATATRMQDVLASSLVSEGRWKSVMDLMDDGYQVPGAGIHEAAQHIAQAGRFLNGMEFIRHKEVILNANLAVDALYGAAQGDAKLAGKLAQYGANPELLQRVKTMLSKHGQDISHWDEAVLADTQNVLLNMTDHVIQANRIGEIPAFMQFSPTARVLLPYLNFAAGAHNKILRRTLMHETPADAAAFMGYQLVYAGLAAGVANVMRGDLWDKNLEQKAAAIAPVAGWFGVVAEAMNNGMRTQVAPFAVLQRAQEAVSTVLHGDGSPKAIAGVLGIGVIPGMGPLLQYLDEATGANERKQERLVETRADRED